jgi:hypothetical protein
MYAQAVSKAAAKMDLAGLTVFGGIRRRPAGHLVAVGPLHKKSLARPYSPTVGENRPKLATFHSAFKGLRAIAAGRQPRRWPSSGGMSAELHLLLLR